MSTPKETTKPFDYCKSPDGEDIVQKFGVLMKPTALTALGMSTIDVMLYSHPKGYLQTLGRYIHISWPFFGATTAFIMATNVAGSIRKKDDKLNWFIGGTAVGSVFGLWKRSRMGGFIVGFAAGMIALAKKGCIENNTFLLVPNKVNFEFGGVNSATKHDWTLTKHRPGNWTTGEK